MIVGAARDVPAVEDAVLIPPRDGKPAVLCLVSRASATDIVRELHNRLESGKVPREIRLFDAFPLSHNSKVDRVGLARRIAEETP